ncbi:MAG: dNTP triphosphohydrolase, partial [Alphaproteobacteria bacterium]|nr:dNTP triphosphohydrolase [Alphaproteobacteria bacterium]
MRQDEIWEERPGGQAERTDDERNQFDTDYARIVHCAAFRRLQSKTQTLNLGDGDFYRTRLTHSLEVAQISGGIVKWLKKHHSEYKHCIGAVTLRHLLHDHSLFQAISLAHDLGHPPFGHGGEVALNYCMRGERGGFEGNGQTFRILSKLETFASPCDKGSSPSVRHSNGLTRRTLLGVLKYPVPYQSAVEHKLRAGRYPQLNKNLETVNAVVRAMSKPPKCYLDSEADEVNWVLKKPLSPGGRETFAATDENGATLYKSFDCSIMDIADDIAYGVHDLEDAIVHNLVSEGDVRKHLPPEECRPFIEAVLCRALDTSSSRAYDAFAECLFGSGDRREKGAHRENKVNRKRLIGDLIHCFLAN